MFLKELFRFVDFRSQVGTASSIRVVQQHELAVVFPNLVFRQHTFTTPPISKWQLSSK